MSDIAQEVRMDDEFITVEEAASRLGKSVAAVRRYCSSGKITASKVGRAWLIDPSTLPRPTGRNTRRVSSASGIVDFALALRHLRTQDLSRDLWVPDILNFADDLADVGRIEAAAADRIDLIERSIPQRSCPFRRAQSSSGTQRT
jgi:excisionase family DNA binding protein